MPFKIVSYSYKNQYTIKSYKVLDKQDDANMFKLTIKTDRQNDGGKTLLVKMRNDVITCYNVTK